MGYNERHISRITGYNERYISRLTVTKKDKLVG